MDHVVHGRTFRMLPAAGAEVLCRVVEPYFERNYEHFCSHRQTPPDKLSPYALAVQNGRVVTIAFPLFTSYGSSANLPYRQLLATSLTACSPSR